MIFLTHQELPTLLQICQQDNSSFSQLKKECDFLTEFYLEARYPAHLPPSNITRQMTEKAQESAKKVGDLGKKEIKSR